MYPWRPRIRDIDSTSPSACESVLRTWATERFIFRIRTCWKCAALMSLVQTEEPAHSHGKGTASAAPSFETQTVDLDPGKVDVVEVEMLNRLYDMTLLGEYKVTAHREVQPPGERAKAFEVASNQIKIIVQEDAPAASTEPASSKPSGPATAPSPDK